MSSNGERPAGADTVKPIIDWQRAAELLAQGMTITEAARQIGCSRAQLSRRSNHDQTFQDLIKTFETSAPSMSEQRMSSLRERLHDAIDTEVQSGNVRVILWLADRLKLLDPPEKAEERSALDDLLSGMTESDLKEFESLK